MGAGKSRHKRPQLHCPQVDEHAVQQFFSDLQQRYQGDYVVDLAGLRDTARAILPLLASREETLPYAVWLSAQMDYLDVAGELTVTQFRRSGAGTNAPPPPPAPSRAPNPPPQTERAFWVRKVSGISSGPPTRRRTCPN